MDNLTHSLAGLTVAELLLQVPQKPVSAKLRLSVYLASIIANNFPDLDFVYVGITSGKLGYLLHHRGHTHTVLFAIPTVIFLYALFWGYQKVKGLRFERWENGLVFGALALGPLLHIFLDSLNSYGVHPFWPWNNDWFYADTLFIIEPSVWAAVLPFLLRVTKHQYWRWVQWALVLLTYGLILFTGMVPWQGILFTSTVGVIAFAVSRLLSPRFLALGLLCAWVLVISIFAISSNRAGRVFREELATHAPGTQLDELVLSPQPSNPFCWSALSGERDSVNFVSRRALLSPYPQLMEAKSCPLIRGLEAPSSESAGAPLAPRARWLNEFVQDQATFRKLAATHCGVQGFLQFSRMPLLTVDGDRIKAGDLRFFRDGEISFAEVRFDSDTPCPQNLPPWNPPRSNWMR